MSLSLKAAIAILSSIKTSYLDHNQLLDIEDDKIRYGELVGPISAIVKQKDFVAVGTTNSFYVHKSHKKTVKELNKILAMPEGMVKFPSKDTIIFAVQVTGSISQKEKDRLMARLIPEGVDDINVEQDVFWIKGSDIEWFAVPFSTTEMPNTLCWAVRSNEFSSKTAIVCHDQATAFATLRDIAANASREKTKRAA